MLIAGHLRLVILFAKVRWRSLGCWAWSGGRRTGRSQASPPATGTKQVLKDYQRKRLLTS